MKTFWGRCNKAWHVNEGNIEVTGPEVWGKELEILWMLKIFLKKSYSQTSSEYSYWTVWHWRWRQKGTPKLRKLFIQWHAVTFQKTLTLRSTAVITQYFAEQRKQCQFVTAHVSQLRYHACFVDADWLQCDWWTGGRCLYKANFPTRVLAVTRFQRPAWRFKIGSRVKFLFYLTLFVGDFL